MASHVETTAQAGSDIVIPLHYFDDSPMFSRITMYALMVYDEVLDPKLLHSTLEKVVRRDTWQKLGGRVRKGAKGLEYHIPREFSKDRPAVSYTHIPYTMAKADHPVARHLPTSSSIPLDHAAIVGDPEQWAELACGSDSPKSIDDYALTDRPVLGLRIISFTDATLVTIHWLHVAADAMGLKAIIESWMLALQGREDEIPSLHGFYEDPLRELGQHAKEPFVIASSQMSKLSTMSYVLRNGYNLLVGQKENRTVCIPRPFWEKLYGTALEELAAATGVARPFLTENDVLTAWWSRLAASHLPAGTPVTMMTAMSARRALEKDLLPPERLYVSNCLSFANTMQTKGEMDVSVGRLAGQIRRGINQQGTRGQIETYQSLVRAGAWPLGPMPVLFGKATMHQVGYSNWTKSNVYMTDLSAAAVNKRETPLYPSFVSQIQTGVPYPDGFIITGKDSKGNYWLEGYRPAGLWNNIETKLAEG